MRTTVEIPDATFRKLKAVAAKCGLSMKEFVRRAVQGRLRRVRGGRVRSDKIKLPLIAAKLTGIIPSMTSAEIEDLLD